MQQQMNAHEVFARLNVLGEVFEINQKWRDIFDVDRLLRSVGKQ